MAETTSTSTDEPPTYFANFVTMNISTDEFTVEFRSARSWHSTVLRGTGGSIIDVPQTTGEEVLSNPPVARVVMTFAAARAMADFLQKTLPVQEQHRKAGK